MHIIKASSICPSFIWFLIPVPAVASVWTVGPGGDFQQIQDAVDAASDGDIVIVQPGSFGSVTIDNLDISVPADAGGIVETGRITVRNIAAHQVVVLSGLTCEI